jgi:hypothetical protein
LTPLWDCKSNINISDGQLCSKEEIAGQNENRFDSYFIVPGAGIAFEIKSEKFAILIEVDVINSDCQVECRISCTNFDAGGCIDMDGENQPNLWGSIDDDRPFIPPTPTPSFVLERFSEWFEIASHGSDFDENLDEDLSE